MTTTNKANHMADAVNGNVEQQKATAVVIRLFNKDDKPVYFSFDERGNPIETEELQKAFRFENTNEAMGTLARLLTTNSRRFAMYHFENEYPEIVEINN